MELLDELLEGGRPVEQLGELLDGGRRDRGVTSGRVRSDERAEVVCLNYYQYVPLSPPDSTHFQ